MPPDSYSDWVLKDVYRRTLSIRRRLRSGSGHLVRAYRVALHLPEIRQTPIEIRKLVGGRGEIRITIRKTRITKPASLNRVNTKQPKRGGHIRVKRARLRATVCDTVQ